MRGFPSEQPAPCCCTAVTGHSINAASVLWLLHAECSVHALCVRGAGVNGGYLMWHHVLHCGHS
jgi:hypothetical protein